MLRRVKIIFLDYEFIASILFLYSHVHSIWQKKWYYYYSNKRRGCVPQVRVPLLD